MPTDGEHQVPVFRPVAVDTSAGPMSAPAFGGVAAIAGHRPDRVLPSGRTQRAAARVRVDHRRARRRRAPARRCRRPRQLHHRPGRRDRARALGRLPGDRVLEPGAVRRRWLDGRAAARGERGGQRRRRRRRRLPRHPGPVRSDALRRRPRRRPSPTSAHSGTTAMQWCMPYGVLTPASWMALNSTRYMHEFGVTSDDFGRAVVQLRAYAATNPNAWGYERPDHARGPPGVALDRRAVHPSVRLLPGDRRLGRGRDHLGRARRATSATTPVRIAAAAGAGLFEQEIASDHYRPDLSVMDGSVALAAPAVRPVRHRPRRHRRGDDLRRVLADPAHAARSARVLRIRVRPRTSSPTATSHSTARCRATPTAVSSARATSTG